MFLLVILHVYLSFFILIALIYKFLTRWSQSTSKQNLLGHIPLC